MVEIADVGDAPFWGGDRNQEDKHYHITKNPPDPRCRLDTVFLEELETFDTTEAARALGYMPCSYCFG